MIATFSYRQKEDGSVESICLLCYLTVAKGHNKKELEQQEREHVCECVPLVTDHDGE